jgi:hypothetical protein
MDKSPIFSSQEGIRPISEMVSYTWNTEAMDEINKKFVEVLIAYFSCYDMNSIENDASSNSSIVACNYLPSR